MKLSNYLFSLVSGETLKSFFLVDTVGLLEMNLATVGLWQKKEKQIVPSCPGLSFKETTNAFSKEQLLSLHWRCDFFCSRVSKLMENHGTLFQKGSVV